jgi:hypothetical protein
MTIALLNDNPVVGKLITLSAKKTEDELTKFESIDAIEAGHYDLVLIDDAMYSDEVMASVKEKLTYSQCGYIANRNVEQPEGFNFMLSKPFLPTDMVDILANLTITPQDGGVEEPLNTDELSFLDEGEDELGSIDDLLGDLDDDLGEEIATLDDSAIDDLDDLSLDDMELDSDLDDDLLGGTEASHEDNATLEEEVEHSILDMEDVQEVQSLLDDTDDESDDLLLGEEPLSPNEGIDITDEEVDSAFEDELSLDDALGDDLDMDDVLAEDELMGDETLTMDDVSLSDDGSLLLDEEDTLADESALDLDETDAASLELDDLESELSSLENPLDEESLELGDAMVESDELDLEDGVDDDETAAVMDDEDSSLDEVALEESEDTLDDLLTEDEELDDLAVESADVTDVGNEEEAFSLDNLLGDEDMTLDETTMLLDDIADESSELLEEDDLELSLDDDLNAEVELEDMLMEEDTSDFDASLDQILEEDAQKSDEEKEIERQREIEEASAKLQEKIAAAKADAPVVEEEPEPQGVVITDEELDAIDDEEDEADMFANLGHEVEESAEEEVMDDLVMEDELLEETSDEIVEDELDDMLEEVAEEPELADDLGDVVEMDDEFAALTLEGIGAALGEDVGTDDARLSEVAVEELVEEEPSVVEEMISEDESMEVSANSADQTIAALEELIATLKSGASSDTLAGKKLTISLSFDEK